MFRHATFLSLVFAASLATVATLLLPANAQAQEQMLECEDYDGWHSDGGFLGDCDNLDHSDPWEDNYRWSYYCEECRDPNQYPMDFIAFFFNGHPFLGEGPFRDTAYYHIKIFFGDGSQFVFVWSNVLLDEEGSPLFPHTQTVPISIMLPNGQVSTFTVLSNRPNLPIGDPNTDGDSDSSNNDEDDEGQNNDDDGDEYNEDEEDDYSDDDEVEDDSGFGDDDFVDNDEGDSDDNCGACESHFDTDEDGDLDATGDNDDDLIDYGWTDEEGDPIVEEE